MLKDEEDDTNLVILALYQNFQGYVPLPSHSFARLSWERLFFFVVVVVFFCIAIAVGAIGADLLSVSYSLYLSEWGHETLVASLECRRDFDTFLNRNLFAAPASFVLLRLRKLINCLGANSFRQIHEDVLNNLAHRALATGDKRQMNWLGTVSSRSRWCKSKSRASLDEFYWRKCWCQWMCLHLFETNTNTKMVN